MVQNDNHIKTLPNHMLMQLNKMHSQQVSGLNGGKAQSVGRWFIKDLDLTCGYIHWQS